MRFTSIAAALSLVAVIACAPERTVAPVVPSGGIPAQVRVVDAAPDTTQTPLFILNGKVIEPPKDGAIDTMKIESVEVIKGKRAIEKYGPRALNGVVIITTKS